MEGYQREITNNGFCHIQSVYSVIEIEAIVTAIDHADQSHPAFRKTEDLFAIRRFLEEIPGVKRLIFTEKFKYLTDNLFGEGYFVVKSIYFDKPEKSNWFVAWHQDLTIAVDKKLELPGYGPWTVKQNRFAVQPPLTILQDNFTVRIHLDDTDEGNGALRVVPGSHLRGIIRTTDLDFSCETQNFGKINAGGIMIMRPLLLHASNRTTTNKGRRVVHIEFSKAILPEEINWAEKLAY